jgi:hypothetical protein
MTIASRSPCLADGRAKVREGGSSHQGKQGGQRMGVHGSCLPPRDEVARRRTPGRRSSPRRTPRVPRSRWASQGRAPDAAWPAPLRIDRSGAGRTCPNRTRSRPSASQARCSEGLGSHDGDTPPREAGILGRQLGQGSGGESWEGSFGSISSSLTRGFLDFTLGVEVSLYFPITCRRGTAVTDVRNPRNSRFPRMLYCRYCR